MLVEAGRLYLYSGAMSGQIFGLWVSAVAVADNQQILINFLLKVRLAWILMMLYTK